MIDETGGPAFPRNHILSTSIFQDERTTEAKVFDPGMSLRDWFAGMAMQGLIAFEGGIMGGQNSTADVLSKDCQRAYLYADAMLAVRKAL